jgi:hypothetical protein
MEALRKHGAPIGGVGILGAEYERVLSAPWRDLRRIVNGSLSPPLHASKFGEEHTPSQLAAISNFFRIRISKQRIADVAEWWAFSSIVVIFEDNPRANDAIERYFGDVVPPGPKTGQVI